jgi:hypothetical protein
VILDTRCFGDEIHRVHAIRISRHFAVHPTVYANDATDPSRWSATHVPSGMSLISAVPLAIAVAAGLELEPAADWDFFDQEEGMRLNRSAWLRCGEIRKWFKAEAAMQPRRGSTRRCRKC